MQKGFYRLRKSSKFSLSLSLSLSLSRARARALESVIDLIDRFFSATKHSDIVNFNGTLRKKKKKGELLYSPLVNSLGLGFDFIFDIKF